MKEAQELRNATEQFYAQPLEVCCPVISCFFFVCVGKSNDNVTNGLKIIIFWFLAMLCVVDGIL